MTGQRDLHFSFSIVGGMVFEVVEFTLEEAFSEPFILNLELASDDSNTSSASPAWNPSPPAISSSDSTASPARSTFIARPAAAALLCCLGMTSITMKSRV